MAETIPTEEETKTSFLKDICAYFRDFLDTDFKRQSAPKRSVTLKDAAGNLTGIDASKYPDLVNEVWRVLRKPIGDNAAFSLAVPRGRYRGRLRTALKDLIDKHAQALSEDELNVIADRGSATGRELKEGLRNDPDQYAETVMASIKADMVRAIVAPLVAKLEGALARARGDAFEAMYNIEEEFGERLIEAAREPIGSALATACREFVRGARWRSSRSGRCGAHQAKDPDLFRQLCDRRFFSGTARARFDTENPGKFRDLSLCRRVAVQPGVLPAVLFVAEY